MSNNSASASNAAPVQGAVGVFDAIKKALTTISSMRETTSTQASASSKAAQNAFQKAVDTAKAVQEQQDRITKMQQDAAAAAAAADASAKEAAAAAQKEMDDAKAKFEEEIKAKQDALVKMGEDATKAAEDAAKKAADEQAAAQKEIDAAKKEMGKLAARANVEANTASKIATLAASKKMSNYSSNQASSTNVNNSGIKSAMNERNQRLKNLNSAPAVPVNVPASAVNVSANQPPQLGGRRRKTRKQRARKQKRTRNHRK